MPLLHSSVHTCSVTCRAKWYTVLSMGPEQLYPALVLDTSALHAPRTVGVCESFTLFAVALAMPPLHIELGELLQ